MKKLNLREQFYKGLTQLQIELIRKNETIYDKMYSEWLETINSEMIDALVKFKQRYSHEVYNQDFHRQVEQALKKAGCVE